MAKRLEYGLAISGGGLMGDEKSKRPDKKRKRKKTPRRRSQPRWLLERVDISDVKTSMETAKYSNGWRSLAKASKNPDGLSMVLKKNKKKSIQYARRVVDWVEVLRRPSRSRWVREEPNWVHKSVLFAYNTITIIIIIICVSSLCNLLDYIDTTRQWIKYFCDSASSDFFLENKLLMFYTTAIMIKVTIIIHRL